MVIVRIQISKFGFRDKASSNIIIKEHFGIIS
jgi:hypothetical protein